jgi:site-specific recombinase XerC
MDLVPHKKQSLTRAQFEQLADIPLEEEWLANITNLKTRRAYKEDVREFVAFTALQDYMGLRSAARSHIIAWRKDMERRGLASATIRRKLSALSSEWLGHANVSTTRLYDRRKTNRDYSPECRIEAADNTM